MNNNLELAGDKFIEQIGHLCGKFGLNDFIAQLYAVLYLSSKPLSLDDLSEKLKSSKGNTSINIRELERWGAVRRVWVRGSRKDFYEAELDLKKILGERIKVSFRKHMSEVANMLTEFNQLVQSASGDLTEEERKIAKTYETRLKKIDELREMTSNALSLAEKLL